MIKLAYFYNGNSSVSVPGLLAKINGPVNNFYPKGA